MGSGADGKLTPRHPDLVLAQQPNWAWHAVCVSPSCAQFLVMEQFTTAKLPN